LGRARGEEAGGSDLTITLDTLVSKLEASICSIREQGIALKEGEEEEADALLVTLKEQLDAGTGTLTFCYRTLLHHCCIHSP